MPKISVIIPVFNVENYLERCIESVRTQTLDDIEIILIDDGSTDSSGIMCDEYARIDSRIKVIHKKNEGLSCARNDGVEVAKASYILFVDSDDWVEATLCEQTYDIAVFNSTDIVLFLHKRIRCDGTQGKNVITRLSEGFISEAEALDFNLYVCCGAWLCLYRKELFKSVQFPPGKLYEDTGTTHRLFHAANSIFLLKEYLYIHLIDRPGSIVGDNPSHPNRQEMIISRFEDICQWGYADLCLKRMFSYRISHGGFPDEYLENQIRDIKGFPKKFSWKHKIMLLFYRTSPTLFDKICIIIKKRKTS